ncbi:MAG: porin family protein [Gammaproteobacteria bacterium]|nr:porin family protein [Gammaproteobacteria bacterium]
MKLKSKVVLATMAILASPVINAADSDIVTSHSKIGQGFAPYLGVNLGSAKYDLANDSSPSFSIFGGLKLNELLSIELGFVDFGDVDAVSVKSEASTLYGSVVANADLSNELTAFVQIGLANWDYDVGAVNDSSVDVFFGGGLNYEVGRNLTARFAIQKFSMDAKISNTAVDEDILNVNFGLLYQF